MKKLFNLISIFTLIGFFPIAGYAEVDAKIPNNTVKIGKSSTADKQIIFDLNSGAANPKIKANGTTSKIQFSNDGTNFKDLGSGSGGGAGTNLIQDDNNDFESGPAGWTASGGAYTIESTSPLSDLGSGKFNSSATSQTLTSALKPIPAGFEARKCQVHIPYYKYASGTAGDYNLKVVNGEGSVIVDSINFAVTGSAATSSLFQTFDCPLVNGSDNSDMLKIVITSTADAGDLIIDDVFLGQGRNEVQGSQTSIYGTASGYSAASCTWSTSTTLGSFAVDSDCINPTVTGKASTPATKIPGINFAFMPPAKYKVEAYGSFVAAESSSGSAVCEYELYDGTSSKGKIIITQLSSKGSGQAASLGGLFEYATNQSDITFQVRAARNNGNGSCQIVADSSQRDLYFIVTKLPISADSGNTYETSGWRVDANISGGNIDLGASDQATYVAPNNASLTLVPRAYSAAVGISCSSTNDNPVGATTCSAGNEEIGIVTNVPKAGKVEVCFDFTHRALTGASGVAAPVFQVVRTENGSQTIVEQGGTRVGSGANVATNDVQSSNHVCGTFSITSGGKKTFRLMYEQDVNGTVSQNILLGDASAGDGQRDFRAVASLLDESMPTPVFNDLIASLASKVESGSSPMRVVGGQILVPAGVPVIDGEYGNFISSLVDTGVGAITVNLVPGKFSLAPACTCSTGSIARHCSLSTSTSALTLYSVTSSTGASVDGNVIFNCIGPK